MTSAHDVDLLVKQIRPILAGKPPELQGAVLTNLVAMFIAGFLADELREQILQLHIKTVRGLIPVNEAMIRHNETRRQ